MVLTCPICDSESIVPARKKAKRITSLMLARIHYCRTCKHKFIVITAVARGALARKLEDILDEVH